MKLRILPCAASLVFAARFLHAEPALAEVTKDAPPAPPPAPTLVVGEGPMAPPPKADAPPAAATATVEAKPAEAAKPSDPPKPTDLPAPKALGDPVKKGLTWLAAHQNSDGGWGQGGGWRIATGQSRGEGNGRVEGANVPDPSDIGNTAIALQAFLRSGAKLDSGEHAEVAKKAAAFILKRVEAADEDSLYVTDVRDTQLQSKIGTYVDTFLAAQILSDLKGRFPDAADEERRTKLLDKVVAKIQKHQQANGGFANNRGWASTLSQGICSGALNSAWAAGAKVDLAALEKDHVQNAEGLNRGDGSVASVGGADAGVEIYRYASKLGGMSKFAENNVQRRAGLQQTADAAASTPQEKEQAQQEISKIDRSDADQKVLLEQVAGKAKEARFVGGFGNNGGEEFISYMNIGEALRNKGGDEWKNWDESMTKTVNAAQNEDGSWAGQHCITGRTFCTASAVMVLMTDRAPAPVAPPVAKNTGADEKKAP